MSLDKCNSLLRGKPGVFCKQPAGSRTDHPGVGRCWLHGGKTPVKHGLNSTVHTSRLDGLIKKHAANPDPLNLLPEVAQLRAFAEDLMQRWESIYGVDGALLAWHESFSQKFDEEGELLPIAVKPRQLPDFSAIGVIVDKVGMMVDRIHKHRMDESISLATIHRVLELFGSEVVEAVKEIGLTADASTKLIKSIESRWGRIRIEPDSASLKRIA